MDQKKTLWIIAAVGAFLLVVLGTAGIFYKPVDRPSPVIASVTPTSQHTSGWTRTNEDLLPPPENGTRQETSSAVKTSDLFVVADTATVFGTSVQDNTTAPASPTTIDLNSLKRDLALDASSSQPQNINITVNVPEQKPADNNVSQEVVNVYNESTRVVANTPSAAVASVSAPAPVAPAPAPKPAAAPAPKAEPAKAVAKAPAPAASKAATPAAAPAPKTVVQYWVQVASLGSKKAAESARSVLDENKISADIFTYQDDKDRLFYRVRVGPYTTKSEAEYWRTRIAKIDEFAKSQSFVTSTVN